MRLREIATDYNGTTASDGALNPAIREAIENARMRGVLVGTTTFHDASPTCSATANLPTTFGNLIRHRSVMGKLMPLSPVQ